MRVVLAEKPSVAVDIARVLGATTRKDGWWEGNGHQVTWAIGHLVGLAQPGDIREEWARRWDPSILPMLPDPFPLTVRENAASQFGVVKRLLTARKTEAVVCATDAGREGELIFRYIYEASGCDKPVLRLWISSLTKAAIEEGFRNLQPGARYDGLADAARTRSIADWLVGMNLSRAYSQASGKTLNIGRVKTPTLAMVAARCLAIQLFKPEPFREVEARFQTPGGELIATYVRRVEDAKGKSSANARLPSPDAGPVPAELDATLIVGRAEHGQAAVLEVRGDESRQKPPELFDLTELQRTANRLWGWPVQKTLDEAQALYERHKLLSYPRTDSRHLTSAVAAELGPVLSSLRGRFGNLVPDATAVERLGTRFVDDGQVGDHHALIPTANVAALEVGTDAQKLYELVARRLLAAFADSAVDAVGEVAVVVTHGEHQDRYEAQGKVMISAGWRAVDLPALQKKREEKQLPVGLQPGVPLQLLGARIVPKETKAPPLFTEASLLSAMESAGGGWAKEVSKAMRDRGLGTPATRASTIEDLLAMGYIERDAKMLRVTALGDALVRRVDVDLASPSLTGDWEAKLRRIERGEMSREHVVREVESFVSRIVKSALARGVAPPPSSFAANGGDRAAAKGKTAKKRNGGRKPPFRAEGG